MKKIIGPFSQVLTLRNLPDRGGLKDEQLEIISDGGLFIVEGKIEAVGSFESLRKANPAVEIEEVEGSQVAMPGFIDAHTHICFGGTRARDFAARNNGKTYQEIAETGGGIWETVTKTRLATQQELVDSMTTRMNRLINNGVTTVEVKSGYGLSVEEELKMLRSIKAASATHVIDTISTCLAAHIVPREFSKAKAYLEVIVEELMPIVKRENLASRFDIFVEDNAYTPDLSRAYLAKAKAAGFDITVHGDQFSTGGSQVAIDVGAVSVDHLEASTQKEIDALAISEVIPVALPGASIGLGCDFTPARKLLDAGCSLVIASDWNPGSGPQGFLLGQAAILSTFEKLSAAEVYAGITFRAAKALKLPDRGKLEAGKVADIVAFPTSDFQEILYNQGELRPCGTWKEGGGLSISY